MLLTSTGLVALVSLVATGASFEDEEDEKSRADEIYESLLDSAKGDDDQEGGSVWDGEQTARCEDEGRKCRNLTVGLYDPDDDKLRLAVEFEFDSAEFTASSKPELASLCDAVRRLPNLSFKLEAHTDVIGEEDYNFELSRLRADAVEKHLTTKCGVKNALVVVRPRGEESPDRRFLPTSPKQRRVLISAEEV